MSRKKVMIRIIYIISMLVFMIIAELNINNFMEWYRETMDYGNILLVLVPSAIAEFLHILTTIIIAIVVKFIKKINLEIKKLFYKLPIITIILWYPLYFLLTYIFF